MRDPGIIMSAYLLLLIAAIAINILADSAPNASQEHPDDTVALKKGIQWVLNQRQASFGWEGGETPRSILTLQLTNGSWYSKDHLDSALTAKQLELEAILALTKPTDVPIRAGRLSLLVLSLRSVCMNPRNFHGHDLLRLLDRLDASHEYEFSLSVLASCLSGRYTKKRHIRRLMDSIDQLNSEKVNDMTYINDGEILALQAMACAMKEHKHRDLKAYLDKPVNRLMKQQSTDGSFGNVHTTALVVQALASLDRLDSDDWSFSDAAEFLSTHVDPHGRFWHLSSAHAILPALAGKSYLDVASVDACQDPVKPLTKGRVEQHNSEEDVDVSIEEDNSVNKPTAAAAGMTSNLTEFVTINYSIWMDHDGSAVNQDSNVTTNITAMKNNSFYDIMMMAALQDKRFEFSATKWPNGHYVHTLSGMREDLAKNKYWLLYRIAEVKNEPLSVTIGIDDFYPKDGDHVVFWYRRI